MQHPKRWIAGASIAVVAALGAGAGFGAASDRGGESSRTITGPARAKAEAAALGATGGGKVTGTEVGDEESLYEVEVTRGDGSKVDVQLDRGFHVVGSTPDSGQDG
jgi:hypothetical protein